MTTFGVAASPRKLAFMPHSQYVRGRFNYLYQNEILPRYDEALKETFTRPLKVSFSAIQEFQDLATLHAPVLWASQDTSGWC